MYFALPQMVKMCRRHGVTVFSNEGDGTAHLRYEEQREWSKRWDRQETEEDIRAGAQRG